MSTDAEEYCQMYIVYRRDRGDKVYLKSFCTSLANLMVMSDKPHIEYCIKYCCFCGRENKTSSLDKNPTQQLTDSEYYIPYYQRDDREQYLCPKG